MDDFISRIVTEVQETEEDFIFTTIQPFCEDVIKRKISKAELAELLTGPMIVRCGECKHRHTDGCVAYAAQWYTYNDDYCSYGEKENKR